MTIYNFEKCMNNFYAQVNCILSLKIHNNNDLNHVMTLKEQIIQNKISNNDFNFSRAHLFNINLRNMIIDGDINFSQSVILGSIDLNNVGLNGIVNLDFAKVYGKVSIRKSKIYKIHMSRICINERILISNSNVNYFHADGDYARYNSNNDDILSLPIKKIRNYCLKLMKKDFNTIKDKYRIKNGIDIISSKIGLISVDKLNIGKHNSNGIDMELVDISIYAVYVDCNIEGNVSIRRVNVEWDFEFTGSRIKSAFSYELSKVKGKLSFSEVIFHYPHAQENASREAKRIWDKLGDKDKRDEYYFSEMEAKRKGKNKTKKYAELFLIQLPFGYGVKLNRVIITFILIILVFAFILWLGKGIESADSFWSNLYVSTLTALKLGYNGYQPVNNFFQLIVTIEAILGAFLWSISIVIFAKKFIR